MWKRGRFWRKVLFYRMKVLIVKILEIVWFICAVGMSIWKKFRIFAYLASSLLIIIGLIILIVLNVLTIQNARGITLYK